MNTRLSFKFAIKNLKAHKLTISAFVLSSAFMLSLLEVINNINYSDFVLRRQSFSSLMFLCTAIIAIFTFIFIIYSSTSMIKKRNKEIALYGILGLEKKHIRKIVFVENLLCFLLILIISSIFTFILGKIMFLTASKILQDSSLGIDTYHYLLKVFLQAAILLSASFIFLYVIEVFKIKNYMPIELINKSKRSEKEPKSNKTLTIAGLLILVVGYIIALTTEGTTKSIGMFFAAALLVMIATYLLYIGLSIIILKLLRKNKNFYYKKEKFISVSSMMYRMKNNAAGLASVTILLTGLIITMTASISVYGSINEAVNSRISTEYVIDWNPEQFENFEHHKTKGEIEHFIKSGLHNQEKLSKIYVRPWKAVFALKKNDEILLGSGDYTDEIPCFIILDTLDWYNDKYNKNIKLDDDEILLSYNNSMLKVDDTLTLADKKFKVRKFNLTIPSNYAIDGYRIILPSYKNLEEIQKYYLSSDIYDIKTESKHPEIEAEFDISGEDDAFKERMTAYLAKYEATINSRKDIYSASLEVNGGVLFVGIVISILFISGTILIIYYKQVFEGYDDRERFQIMKKVGLDNKLIKKTTSKQILWLFFSPLLASLMHSIIASKIVFQLLALFGINRYVIYFKNMIFITLIIAVIYFIIFKITSRIYYSIVVENK